MGLPIFFILFIITILVFHAKASKSEKALDKSQKQYWKKEQASHYVRKKELSDEDFIEGHPQAIPSYDAEFYKVQDRPNLYSVQEQCRELAQSKMLNFSGLLNSDVRLKYGTGQLDTIEQYENNYNKYIQYLGLLSSGLMETGHLMEAKALLEEAVTIGSDVSHIYIHLGDIYQLLGETEALEALLKKATSLDSLMKGKIIQHLRGLIGGNDLEES